MPNWVRNNVVVSGNVENIQKFVNECIDKENRYGDKVAFTFDKIIPMPKSLNIECGSHTDLGMEYWTATDERKKEIEEEYPDKELFEEMVSLGKVALDNKEKYGFSTWYDWSIANWGTKWDAYKVSVKIADNSVSIYFDTAWNTPVPVMLELSKKFDVKVSVEFADEDLGQNCGAYTIEKGQMISSKEGDFEFACGVWGYDPSDFDEED